jgi:hypothetical protein
MKLWERSQNTINNWQAVFMTRIGFGVLIFGCFLVFAEIFMKPGTQFGLAVVGIGAGIMAGGDALATYETHIDKRTPTSGKE